MKEYSLQLHYQVYDHPDELPLADRNLLQAATEVLTGAYAPYSAFKVGAAALLANGKVIRGSNQENVAYPSGLCAERVALFYASAQFPDENVEAIAVTALSDEFEVAEPVTPCGACRQVMAETETRHENSMRVIMRGATGRIYVAQGINNLLPLMFQADELKKYINGADLD